MQQQAKRCTACGGTQIPVVMYPQAVTPPWRVARPNAGLQGRLSGRGSTTATTFACTSCGHISFYADNLQALLAE
ncbi:MAG TPA: hypothetical protein VHD63_12795 [Ktedonobacteraceae bacterium]|nr:hypothetical protein [Ktedonobacteraceae bacterium]